MKKISYEKLVTGRKFDSYQKEAEYIFALIDSGKIRPILSSEKNGKHPALHTRYWLIEEERDYSEYADELRNVISPIINIDYYLEHMQVYEKERKYVIELSEYLGRCKEELSIPVSENERSFAIWKKEKFLSGKSYDGISAGDVLKHCGLEKDYLNTYRTAEPLAYYSYSKSVPQNILILENLDPFYSIRRQMLNGNNNICGAAYDTLVYGGGKRVVRAFEDFEVSSEPYMKDKRNHLFYAGDLDYEGISIYESLARRMCAVNNAYDKDAVETIEENLMSCDEGAGIGIKELRSEQDDNCYMIMPCMELYNRMLDRACEVEVLPVMKIQKVIDVSGFAKLFSDSRRDKLLRILEEGRYVPQEILSASDYSAFVHT